MDNSSSLLFKASLFVWFVALTFYGAGVLSLGVAYLRIPVLNVIALPADLIAALLLWLTQFPVPLLFILRNHTVHASFGFTYTDSTYPFQVGPGKWTLGDGTWIGGYLLCLVGLTGVIICLVALRKLKRHKEWAWVFIGLAVCAYLLSIIDAITGVCYRVAWDFSGTHAYCEFGFLSAWPNFLSSTILLISGIVIYLTTHRQDPLVSATSAM